MTGHDEPRISVDDEEGRCVAAADIQVDGSAVRASLHVEPGHLPVGARARLVDAVLATPEVSTCEHVQVSLPLGDTEILDRVRVERGRQVNKRGPKHTARKSRPGRRERAARKSGRRR